MSSGFKTIALAGVCALGLAGVALASGGGGGGSSSMPSNGGGVPSASAPAYDPAAEYAKAIAALKAGQYKDATRAAQHVTDAMPKSPDGWKILGAAQAGANDWKGSRKAYEKGVHLAPDDVGMHAGLALALANLKDAKAQAELDWLKAKIAACGDACPEGPKMKAAADEIQNVMSPAPKPSASLSGSMLFGGPKAGDAAYVQAVGLINMRRYDEALAELAKAREAFGPHPDILTYQGYASRKKGELDQAEHYYKEALQAAPNHVGATEYYGELKVERGDIAGARQLLAKLDGVCTFGCAEAEELRHWIDLGHDPQGQ
jgi:Tfp pilus assembly protein PilF